MFFIYLQAFNKVVHFGISHFIFWPLKMQSDTIQSVNYLNQQTKQYCHVLLGSSDASSSWRIWKALHPGPWHLQLLCVSLSLYLYFGVFLEILLSPLQIILFLQCEVSYFNSVVLYVLHNFLKNESSVIGWT